jgi:hypothetical protein
MIRYQFSVNSIYHSRIIAEVYLFVNYQIHILLEFGNNFFPVDWILVKSGKGRGGIANQRILLYLEKKAIVQ